MHDHSEAVAHGDERKVESGLGELCQVNQRIGLQVDVAHQRRTGVCTLRGEEHR